MTKPMMVQTSNRIHVPMPRFHIIVKQTIAPTMQVNHGAGVLNGRSRSGRVCRSTSTPMHTVTNAARVPIDTISPRIPTGKNPPMRAARTPVTTVPVLGVWNLGWTFAKDFQINPSRAIARKIRA